MIEVRNLTRKFGELTAVDSLTFQVAEGEVFGLLGPNGAGKTTTVRMLCCLISKTSGGARIAGYDIENDTDSLAIRKLIGLVPDNVGLYEELSAYENLDYYGKLYECPEGERKKRIEYFLKMLELWEKRDQPVRLWKKQNETIESMDRCLEGFQDFCQEEEHPLFDHLFRGIRLHRHAVHPSIHRQQTRRSDSTPNHYECLLILVRHRCRPHAGGDCIL